MKVDRRYLPSAEAAVAALGSLVAVGRHQHGWTVKELAERLGVHPQTLRRLDPGEPGVSVGLAFEAAVLCGVELFSSSW